MFLIKKQWNCDNYSKKSDTNGVHYCIYVLTIFGSFLIENVLGLYLVIFYRKFCVCLVFYYKFHGATREIPLFCREIRVNFIKISWIFRCNACFLTLERCFYWTEYVNFAMIIVVWIFIYLSLSWDSHFCKWWVVTSISQWEFNLRLR